MRILFFAAPLLFCSCSFLFSMKNFDFWIQEKYPALFCQKKQLLLWSREKDPVLWGEKVAVLWSKKASELPKERGISVLLGKKIKRARGQNKTGLGYTVIQVFEKEGKKPIATLKKFHPVCKKIKCGHTYFWGGERKYLPALLAYEFGGYRKFLEGKNNEN